MANYLLIESRDPFEYADVGSFYDIATDLAREGNQVTFFLVQNGVLPARQGVAGGHVAQLLQKAPGVTVLADGFSLRERGIPQARLQEGVSPADMDRLVDMLADPATKSIWH